MLDDLVRQIVHVDHRLGHAGIAELVQDVVEQRAAGHLHQRLWHMVRQGPHAQAEAGSEDHGFGGLDGHLRDFSNRESRCVDHTMAIRAAQGACCHICRR